MLSANDLLIKGDRYLPMAATWAAARRQQHQARPPMNANMRTAPTTAPTTIAQILTCLSVPGSCTVLTVDEGSAFQGTRYCHEIMASPIQSLQW